MTFQQAFDIFVGGIQKMGSILAVIVVVILLAVYLPMFSMYGSIM